MSGIPRRIPEAPPFRVVNRAALAHRTGDGVLPTRRHIAPLPFYARSLMTASASVVSEDRLREFKASFRGELLRPGTDAYESARKVWNGMIDRRPSWIARCRGVEDVQIAIRFARENDLPLAIRGGGHNAAGLGTCDGGLVIDLRGMRDVVIDPATRTARAGGGATWGEFDAATTAHGLATTGGAVSTTGIAGLTLGGGLGWLMRAYG